MWIPEARLGLNLLLFVNLNWIERWARMKHSLEARLKLIEVNLDSLLEAYTREDERHEGIVESWVLTHSKKRTRDFMDTTD